MDKKNKGKNLRKHSKKNRIHHNYLNAFSQNQHSPISNK